MISIGVQRIRIAVYWFTTVLTVLAFVAIGIGDLSHAPAIMASLQHLGYPGYLANVLGMWKLLGAAAVIVPGFYRVKDWAYAGMFFDLTGAAISHIASGSPLKEIVVPLGLLLVVLTSQSMSRRSVAGS